MYYIYKIRTVRENNNKIFLRNRNISLSKRCLYFHFNFLMDSKKIYSENYWTQTRWTMKYSILKIFFPRDCYQDTKILPRLQV